VKALTQETSLQIFRILLAKAFDDANKELYYEKRHIEALDLADNFSFSENEAPFASRSIDQPSFSGLAAQVDLDEEHIVPRREFVWVPSQTKQSLEQIRRESANFLRLLSMKATSARKSISRHSAQRPSRVRHRCPGYRRMEVTFTPSIRQSMVVLHFTPAPGEVCPVCNQVADTGGFRCICGHGDDGHSPTIQCRRCSMWHHRHCMDSDSFMNNFLCLRCRNLEKLEARVPSHSLSQYYPQPIPPFRGKKRNVVGEVPVVEEPPKRLRVRPCFSEDLFANCNRDGWRTAQDMEPYWKTVSFQKSKPQDPSLKELHDHMDDSFYTHKKRSEGALEDIKTFWGISYLDYKVHLQLDDVPAWLRLMQLQTYTANFKDMNWKDIVLMDGKALMAKGVPTRRARKKVLRIFKDVHTWLGM